MPTYQPDGAYRPPDEGGGSIFGKQLVLVLAVTLAGIILYKSCDGGLFSGLFSGTKEVPLTYRPADFQPNLDEETTLRIISEPHLYKKEFNELVYNFNVSLLHHLATRMGLADSIKYRLEPEYRRHHEYLKTMYYNDFVALKDTASVLYDNWYKDNANQAVRVFNEVAGKYTCFFVTQILATLLKNNSGKLIAKGKKVDTPCGIAITEGLQPMMARLQKKAEIMDFSASRGLLKEKVRKGIAELATYELRSRLGIDKELQYKIFGIPISTTDIRVEAISVVKAGFKLDQYFDITFSPKKGTIFVTLPNPTVLSHEVYPRVDKLDVGFLAGISGDEMNRNFAELKRQFLDDALNKEKVLDRARMRGDTVMQLMLGPVVRSINRNYKLQVRYQDGISPSESAAAVRNDAAPPPTLPDPTPRQPSDAPKPRNKTGKMTQ